MLAERYRIVGLLGKGGMGEVYRAEDIKLEQEVALKFLPDALAMDGAMLARFHGEVRVARQITHANVCRVHDIGEVEAQHFLSMEFIDGEDLSSLLRRIGRLPGDKAVEIARQMCAGLAAAHDSNVLHRDFKPANVMIDGRGKVRITDFGLAGLAEEFRGEEVRAGTPAYMSPEQLTGKEVTVKSDLYALGLVLYEIFTGKRAFEASTIAELVRLQEQTTPTNPSQWVKEIDPLVGRIILRCLDKDPQQRPASAIQVAAALPGGDPLQAALAAGETPSPEMVAAAGEKTGLRPMVAVVCLLAVIISLIALAYLNHRTYLIERIPFESSPEVLARKGREISAQLGYPERPFNSAYGLHSGTSYQDYIEEKDKSQDRWKRLAHGRGAVIHLWYRESQSPLVPSGRFAWEVEYTDPPQTLPGMVGVEVDTLGRLLDFRARPPQVEEQAKSGASPAATPAAPDWKILFTLAGLEMSRFTPADPQWNPESICDARAAWTGTWAELPDLALRVEAASYHGKFVSFQLIYPWTKPITLGASWNWGWLVSQVLLAVILLGAVLLARRNYKQGKGDRRGAFRLACLIFVAQMLYWLFTARHVLARDEFDLLGEGIRSALFVSAATWVLYLALEPYVRRRWPTSLITWSRVLDGKLTDPLAGRDALIGIMTGIGFGLGGTLQNMAANKLTLSFDFSNLLGLRFVLGNLASSLVIPVIAALCVIFLLTLLRALLRRDWLAAAVVVLIFTLQSALWDHSLLNLVGSLVFASLLIFVFIRFGLLAIAVALFLPITSLPLTTNFSTWYAGTTLFAMGFVLALAAFAFRTSLGGKKVFEGKLLED
jgi:serine/threonine-protein kinase